MKKKPYTLLRTVLLCSALLTAANGRTWTSADGSKTFEANLKSYDASSGEVVVSYRNGKTQKFNQSVLSADDIVFLKSQGGSSVSGKEIPEVLPDHDGKEADTSKPVQVFIMMGQSNMLGFGKTAGLKAATEQGLYPYLVDDAGDWITRNDVRSVRVMCSGSGPWKTYFNDWLSGGNGSGAKGGTFGPEIGIGHYLGYALDEPVLLIKTCIGNRALGWDLLPPSADGTGNKGVSYQGNPDDPERKPITDKGWYAGIQYDGDTTAAKEVLKKLGEYYPGANSFEVAGFFWWQGAADPAKGSVENYEENLVHLIKDLRKDFNAPNAKFVCATMGHEKKGGKITDAQLAVDGESGKHPEFKGNVATFYSHPVSKGGSANGHYGGNAETYMNIGDGMGRAMAELLAK